MKSHEIPTNLLDLVRERIRLRHLTYSIGKGYIEEIQGFMLPPGEKHRQEMREERIMAPPPTSRLNTTARPALQTEL